jgi:hypothetical protein
VVTYVELGKLGREECRVPREEVAMNAIEVVLNLRTM